MRVNRIKDSVQLNSSNRLRWVKSTYILWQYFSWDRRYVSTMLPKNTDPIYTYRMVYSNSNRAVVYKETPTIDPEDVGYASTLYEMDVLGKPVVVVLGKAKHTFIERNIVFYPIYLVDHTRVHSQIGVVEVDKNRVIDITDEDGELYVEQLAPPLLYGFVNETWIDRSGSDAEAFVRKYAQTRVTKGDDETEPAATSVQEKDEHDEVVDVHVPKNKTSAQVERANYVLQDGIFETDPHIRVPADLPEETEEDAKHTRQEYTSSQRDSWIVQFMKNKSFDIHDVESNGDCFFAVVRDAFKQIGKVTTVAALRALVAKEATEDLFQDTRALYTELTGSIREQDQEMRNIKRTIETVMKKRAAKVRDQPDLLQQIMKETEDLKGKFKELRENKRSTQELLSETMGPMETIDTLEKYREFIQTSSYWANAWAISTLERVLRVKFIIFSQRAYTEGNLDGVVECGEIDKQLQTAKHFEPTHYIMTSYSGDHYRLVVYKHKRIFRYHELPYFVKTMVVNKCLEKNAGAFYIIPDFRALQNRLGIDTTEDEVAALDNVPEDEIKDEYDPHIVFMFYEQSAKTAKPGKGTGEKIPTNQRGEFIPLSQFQNWRQILDDSWTQTPFRLDNHRWASVEHYYQGAKFKKQNPEFSLQFSLDSGSEISKDVDLAHTAGSKSGKPTSAKAKAKVKAGMTLRPANIQIDPDFYGERSIQERTLAVRAKFTQNEDAKRMLMATKKALLVHFVRGAEPEPDHILMNVRHSLHL